MTEQETCERCHDHCAECTDATNDTCTVCKDDYTQLPGLLRCEEQCPSGWTEISNECTTPDNADVCFVFDDKVV
jgi:hypothetical protein